MYTLRKIYKQSNQNQQIVLYLLKKKNQIYYFLSGEFNTAHQNYHDSWTKSEEW